MTDWKPVNPCTECPDNPNNCRGVCPLLSEYIDRKSAQHKLLEYLIAKAKNEVIAINRREELVNGINPYELESMLKELEASQ